MSPVEFMRSLSVDPVVNRRLNGITVEQNNAPAMVWIEHVQGELMDVILYLERLKTEM